MATGMLALDMQHMYYRKARELNDKSTPEILREFAPAKINLCLQINDHRTDGFHLLQSLVVFTATEGDLLEASILPEADLQLRYVGEFTSALPDAGDNIILRAAQNLQRKNGIKTGAVITLHKNLPVAGGIGSGSADAAAILRLLTKLWDINTDNPEIAEGITDIARALGADVPACVFSGPLIMTGTGDKIIPVGNLPPLPLLLVNPKVGLPTQQVFLHYDRKFAAKTPAAHNDVDEKEKNFINSVKKINSTTTLIDFLRNTGNDLQQAARELCPQIDDVLRYISARPGCLLAEMSGSGASCFGIFANLQQAQQAEEVTRREYPGWWARAVMSGSSETPERQITTGE